MGNRIGRENRTADVARARRISVKAAAPLLGVSIFMVRSLVRQRQLAHYKIGRRIVLDVGDVERYLLEHRVEARVRGVVIRREEEEHGTL